jgi:hypothetical protein
MNKAGGTLLLFQALLIQVIGAARLACLFVEYLIIDDNLSFDASGKYVPPWRRGQPEGQGMDPPRRGGFCKAD